MKNKFLAALALAFLFLFQGAFLASASDVPELNWERGRQQSITLGGETAAKLWSINLRGMNKSLLFERSSANEKGFIVYSVDIPADLPIGKYQVVVTGPGEQPSTTAYVNVLEIVSYDPLTDPRGVGVIAVVAFTLLSFFSGNKDENESAASDENEEDASALGSVDTNYQGIKVNKRGKGDFKGIGNSTFARKLDEIRHLSVFTFSSRSPLLARIAADGSYMQSLFGPLSLVLPLFGVALGVLIAEVSDLNSSLVPTSVGLMLAVIILGILDALSGVVAVLIFGLFAMINGAITSVVDVRTLFGLALLWFTPSLSAGATRPLRRAREDWDLWERLTDILISTLITGWAIKGMVLALDGFAHQKTTFATHSDLVVLIGGVVVLIRYLLEEFTSRYTPERMEFLTPPKLKSQDFQSFLITLAVRAALFIFFMYGFFGLSWQIFAATVVLILPTFLKRFDEHLPNFAWLWQVIPGGIPSIVIMSYIGFMFSNWVNTLPLMSADKTKTILILTSLPGLVVGLLKLFARSPKSGDVRWYRRDKLKPLYRFGGPFMLAIATLITIGVLP